MGDRLKKFNEINESIYKTELEIRDCVKEFTDSVRKNHVAFFDEKNPHFLDDVSIVNYGENLNNCVDAYICDLQVFCSKRKRLMDTPFSQLMNSDSSSDSIIVNVIGDTKKSPPKKKQKPNPKKVKTVGGHPIWTKQEMDELRRFVDSQVTVTWSDFKNLIPGRSASATYNKAKVMGLI